MLVIGLFLIIVIVLILPFSVKKVERNLEAFLFIMGVISVTVTHTWGNGSEGWSLHLIKEAMIEPVKITIAVLIAGILFRLLKSKINRLVIRVEEFLGERVFAFLVVVFLGLFSSIITAIIASLILVEIISILRLDKKLETNITILACYSIGLGAALTPIGEPLSTIAIAKLKGNPHNADFFFIIRILGFLVIPGVIVTGLTASFLHGNNARTEKGLTEGKTEEYRDIFLRTFKVYVFVMALIFLGSGFKPIIDLYISKMSSAVLYWVNTISAILDNATLTAAEIGPSMDIKQIQNAMMGLLIAGGMLIPGNIPNIISAGKLGIGSKEWARFGIPFGFVMMIVYFIILQVI